MRGNVKSKWKHIRQLSELYSPADFSLLLIYERNRADRNNSQFSVVIFKFRDEDIQHNHVKSSINLIKQNIRAIDYIGWHDDNSLGVILPQTDYRGAVQFAGHLEKYLTSLDFEKEILQYPEDPDSDHKIDLFKDFAPPIPFWKISLDKIGSIIGFIVFSPIFLLLPLYIKIVSPGPVFYSQVRIGYRGKEFKFWKFRTMYKDTSTKSHNKHLKDLINSDRPMTKLDERDDPRIIPGGKILRKACIDEIPQIFNIFKGEMSLVGPRPCLPYEAQEYQQWHKSRFDINPGLTGLWQVSGKNNLTFRQMIQLDINYSRNMSLLLDLRIITATLPAIFKMIWEAVMNRSGIEIPDLINKRRKRGNL